MKYFVNMKLKSQHSLHLLLTTIWKWNDGKKGKVKKLMCIWPNGPFPTKKTEKQSTIDKHQLPEKLKHEEEKEGLQLAPKHVL